MSSFWTLNKPIFPNGRDKIQIPLLIQLCLFTGARRGAFVPASNDKEGRGLRYKVISGYPLDMFTCLFSP